MTAPVLTLEYASTTSLGRPQLHAAAKSMVWTSVLSGLCVGSCFLCFTGNWIAYLVHVVIFAATIGLAVRSGIQIVRATGDIEEPARKLRMVMDYIAGGGLMIIALAPVGIAMDMEDSGYGALFLGIAYAMLAGTTVRHVLLYRFLASFCTQMNRIGMARSFQALGWFKAFYECIWLGCCAMALLMVAGNKVFGMSSSSTDGAIIFAFGGLFGIAGFAFVWIWMMIVHGRFVQLAK